MNIRQLLTIACLTIVMSATNTEKANADNVFKQVDDQGHITFTDNPTANSESSEVKLAPINTQPALVRPSALPETPTDAVEVPYTMSRITQPGSNSTVTPGQRTITVQISLKPDLQDGHLVKLYHNGHLYGTPSSSTSYSLSNLIRGLHQVRAEIIGEDGKKKASTQTVNFHVKRYRPKS